MELLYYLGPWAVIAALVVWKLNRAVGDIEQRPDEHAKWIDDHWKRKE